jgi:hypothetical protein
VRPPSKGAELPAPGPFAGKTEAEIISLIREAVSEDRIDLSCTDRNAPQRKVRFMKHCLACSSRTEKSSTPKISSRQPHAPV